MRLTPPRRRSALALPLALAASLLGADAASAADVNCSLFGGPCDIAFPDTNLGSTSTKSVEMTNDGPPGSALSASITTGAEFSLSANTCNGTPLASGATCTFSVVYGPTGATNHASSDTLTIDAGGFPPIMITGGLSGQAIGGIPPTPTPAVSGASPGSGAAGQATTVTLTGTDFGSSSGDLTAVNLDCGAAGTHAGTNVTWVSATSLTVDVPALAAGSVCTFTVTANGQTSSASTANYTFNAPPPPPPTPTVGGVSPSSGLEGQAARVTLTGTEFGASGADLTGVTLLCATGGSGGTDVSRAASGVIWISRTTLAFDVPAFPADTSCRFKVTANGQTSAPSSGTYVFVAAPKPPALPTPTPDPVPGTTPTPTPTGVFAPGAGGGFTITGTDGSSLNTGDLTPPGGGSVSVQNGTVVVPSGGTKSGSLSAIVTSGTSPATPTVLPKPAKVTVKLSLNFVLPALIDSVATSFTKYLASEIASAANVSASRIQITFPDNLATSSVARRTADPVPCTASTPAGTRCRVTWKLPKVAPGAWALTLRYGGLSVPVTYVSQPALKVTPSGSRCIRRGAPGAAARVRTDKGGKVAVVAVKLTGSALGCRGATGTTGRQPAGKPKLVSKNAANAATVRSGMRRLGRGDYLLVWLAGASGTPSSLATTLLKVR